MQYPVQGVGLYRGGIAIILGLCYGLSTKSSFPFRWGASEWFRSFIFFWQDLSSLSNNTKNNSSGKMLPSGNWLADGQLNENMANRSHSTGRNLRFWKRLLFHCLQMEFSYEIRIQINEKWPWSLNRREWLTPMKVPILCAEDCIIPLRRTTHQRGR